MSKTIDFNLRKNNLFLVLGMIFLTNAIVAEFIGAKIFSLEKSLGIEPLGLNIFGGKFNFDMTAGVILWPFVFILTDIINEYFGKKGVQKLSWIAASLLIYSFLAVRVAMWLDGADFWNVSGQTQGLNDMQNAFNAVFGQGLMIILGSLVAFVIGQMVDAFIFERCPLEKIGSPIPAEMDENRVPLPKYFSEFCPVVCHPIKVIVLNPAFNVGSSLLFSRSYCCSESKICCC